MPPQSEPTELKPLLDIPNAGAEENTAATKYLSIEEKTTTSDAPPDDLQKETYVVAYENWTDDTIEQMRTAGRLWKKYGVPIVLMITILIPVVIFRGRYYDDFLKDNW
eukprot:12877496-Ditylum_brightwellii.AAC.1